MHRGAGYLSQRSTSRYERAREVVAEFVGARADDHVIFTGNTTDSINLLAGCVPGEVVVLDCEHHANLLPWKRIGARVISAPLSIEGTLEVLEAARRALEIPELNPRRAFSYSPRLYSAYADVLEALHIPLDLDPDRAVRQFEASNFTFLFAPAYHGAMRHVGPVRAEIGFRTVVQHVDFAVLKRIHRARIHVEVRVQLLHRHPQTAGGEKLAEARGGEPLAEGGGHAPGHEDVFRQARHGLQPYVTRAAR